MKNFKYAFTLAEVLITLGVIGVVATMTMPVLIQNHRKSVVETRLQKFYSTISQAVQMCEAENENAQNWILNCDNGCTSETLKEWYTTYIGKYLKSTDIVEGDSNDIFVYLADGGILRIESNFYDMGFILDKKSMYKGNRIAGKNYFAFRFQNKEIKENTKYNTYGKFTPYATFWDGTKDGLYNTNNNFGCAQNGMLCTKLIQYNGWKIPKNYPVKL